MPPKAKYTREEIIEKAFEIAREKGIDAVVARELAKAMGTSPSPIFTAFSSMEEVQAEVRKRALREFESYVSDALNYTPAFKYVGIKMVEFAMREPKLFQLVYMREHDGNQSFDMLVAELGDTVGVCIEIMQKEYDLTKEEADMLFRQVWLQTFAVCVLVAGKVCKLTPEEISEMLSAAFKGTLILIKSGNFKPEQVRSIDDKK